MREQPSTHLSGKNQLLFVALMPLVCACAVILLRLSVGLVIGIGVLGLAGVAGLVGAWIGLSSGITPRRYTLNAVLLCLGWPAAMFGLFRGGVEFVALLAPNSEVYTPFYFFLGQWSTIFLVLSGIFFIAGERQLAPAATSGWRSAGFVAVCWGVSAAIALGPYLWADARTKANYYNSDLQVKTRAFRNNGFASAFCSDEIDRAALELTRANPFPTEHVLEEALSSCLHRTDSMLFKDSDEPNLMFAKKVDVAIAAILAYERAHPVKKNSVCASYNRAFLFHANMGQYGSKDLNAVERYARQGLPLDCLLGFQKPDEPIWFSTLLPSSEIASLTVEKLKRIQAMGVNLDQRDEMGQSVFELRAQGGMVPTPEIKQFLDVQGIRQ